MLATVFQYQYQLGVAASEYRRGLSPKIMYPLLRVPLLTFLLPNAVMVWIGSVVLRRCGFLELLKFLVLLPVTYAANMAWAAGFYRGLRTEPVPGDRIGPQDRE